MIAGKIREMVDAGAEFIAVTGGMSVDPDDRTPMGIRKAGGEIITYGASVLPGAMFMLAYIGDVPVVGLPGCVMYVRTSIFDLIVPRILTGEIPTKKEIKKLAYGGLCLSCPECTYPQCGFGR
jgi:molybdopterin biosynthesis enzyme